MFDHECLDRHAKYFRHCFNQHHMDKNRVPVKCFEPLYEKCAIEQMVKNIKRIDEKPKRITDFDFSA